MAPPRAPPGRRPDAGFAVAGGRVGELAGSAGRVFVGQHVEELIGGQGAEFDGAALEDQADGYLHSSWGGHSCRPVVFLVSEANGWVTMLIDEDRYLALVPLSDIKTQRICHLNGQLGEGQTLYQWLRGQPYGSPNLGCWVLTDQPREKAAHP
jgi:hypothetical protein